MSTLSLKGDALRRASERLGLPASPTVPTATCSAPATPKPAKHRRDRSAELLALLRCVAPLAFRDPPVPLAIGARHEVKRMAECYSRKTGDGSLAHFTARDIHVAMYHWCSRSDYLRALISAAPRMHLDGSSAGNVTDDEAAHAQQQLALLAQARAGGKK